MTQASPSIARSSSARDSARLLEVARMEPSEAFKSLETSLSGLSFQAVAERQESFGPNEVAKEKHQSWLIRLLLTTRNPLVILLAVDHIDRAGRDLGDPAHGVG